MGKQFDPFGDSSDAAWSDPEAFYDRPPPPIMAPAAAAAPTAVWNSEGEREGEGEAGPGENEQLVHTNNSLAIQEIDESGEVANDDDTTGGSAYIDTSEFLRTRAQPGCNWPSEQGFLSDDPFVEGDDLTPTCHSEGVLGQYEFPAALANFPNSRDGKPVGAEDCLDSKHQQIGQFTCTCSTHTHTVAAQLVTVHFMYMYIHVHCMLSYIPCGMCCSVATDWMCSLIKAHGLHASFQPHQLALTALLISYM